MEESPLAQSASMIWNSSFDNLGVGTSFSYACLIFYYICLLSSRTWCGDPRWFVLSTPYTHADTNLNRKSGVAQWSDLMFLFWFSHRIVILSGAPHRWIA